MSTVCEIAHMWMSQNTFGDKLTLVWVMNWCRHAPSHYRSPDLCDQMASLHHNELTWCRYIVTHCGLVMMTSSNGNIFRVTGPLCGEFTGPGEFPAQRPVTRNFDVFFDLRPNKRLSTQPWGWWFETPSWSLWHQCNGRDMVTSSQFINGSRHLLLTWINVNPTWIINWMLSNV